MVPCTKQERSYDSKLATLKLVNDEDFAFKDEDTFWKQLVKKHLDKNLDRIENEATLKEQLLTLRNSAAMSLFIMNMIWMCLMQVKYFL